MLQVFSDICTVELYVHWQLTVLFIGVYMSDFVYDFSNEIMIVLRSQTFNACLSSFIPIPGASFGYFGINLGIFGPDLLHKGNLLS